MPHEWRKQGKSAQNSNQASESLGDPSASKHKVLRPWQHGKTLTSLWCCTLSSLVMLTPLWTDRTALPGHSSSSSFSLGNQVPPGSADSRVSQLELDLLFLKLPSARQPQTYTHYSARNVTLVSSPKVGIMAHSSLYSRTEKNNFMFAEWIHTWMNKLIT